MNYDVKILPATGGGVLGILGHWYVALAIIVAVYGIAYYLNTRKRIKG